MFCATHLSSSRAWYDVYCFGFVFYSVPQKKDHFFKSYPLALLHYVAIGVELVTELT